jgi:hypothetical protein
MKKTYLARTGSIGLSDIKGSLGIPFTKKKKHLLGESRVNLHIAYKGVNWHNAYQDEKNTYLA